MKCFRALSIPLAIACMTATAQPIVARAQSSLPSEKPAIMVMGFESGTVTAQVRDKRGLGSILAGMGAGKEGENYEPSQLGVGIADMLVEKLEGQP